jgi:radical SAM superfamily enzyme YgiQ (UPF0313 family)
MDRNHPGLLRFQSLAQAISREDGTGRYYKEIIDKPDILKKVPRRYGRYGIPLPLLQEEIKRYSRPDVILMTSGMTYWYPGVVQMISLLKNVFPDVPVILGGIYATLFPGHARRKSGADHVSVGEGEIQALNIVDEITGNHSDIERYRSIDDFPGPAYGLYPRLDSAALLTSRGCPYRCPFCASHILSGEYRARDTRIVANEIESLHKSTGVRHLAFYDDALLFQKEDHLVPVLEEIIRRKIKVRFHTPNGIQPREIDEKTARLMKNAGFMTIRLSYESSNKERQKSMRFKVRDDDLIDAVGFLTETGFDRRQLGSYVLVGLPDQSVAEVVESMLFVLKLGIRVSLASFSPIPGTAYWRQAVEEGLLPEDVDPLLTNNSLLPLQSEMFTYEIFLKLGTLSGLANRILRQNGDPLVYGPFIDLLDDISRNID